MKVAFVYSIMSLILLAIFIDVVFCFFRVNRKRGDSVFFFVSILLGFLDILTTIIASKFDILLFHLREMNPIIKFLIDENNLALSIIVFFLLKLVFHSCAIIGLKSLDLLVNNGIAEFHELKKYTFKEYFFYSRSIRQITDPIRFLKNKDDNVGPDFIFSVVMSSRAEILGIVLFYIVIILNNISVILFQLYQVPGKYGAFLKYGTITLLVLIVLLSQIVGFRVSKRIIANACDKENNTTGY